MESKHRVLHFVGYMRRAGIETFLMNVYRNIDKGNVQFDFLCAERKIGDYDEEIKKLGGHIYYLNSGLSKKSGPLKYLDTIEKYRKTLVELNAKKKFTCVHIHSYHAFDVTLMVLGCKLAGIKKIIVHSHNAFAPHPKLNKVFAKYLNRAKIIRLACGRDAGKWLYGPNGQFIVIHNGINLEKFKFDNLKREKARKQLGVKATTPVILNVARFEKQKNHSFLVHVFDEYYKQNPDAILVLAGNGILEEKIKNIVDTLPCHNNVKFLGVRRDIDELMSGADLFIMTSFFEGFPVTAVEAETSGLPCLYSNSITEEVQFTKHVEFESLQSSTENWAQHINNLLRHKYSRVEDFDLAENHGFDIRAVAKKLETLYLNL